MRQVRILVSLLLAALSLAACTYDRGNGPPGVHFAEFRVAPPDKNSVEVCHAYTCAEKTTFYFRPKDIKEIATVMQLSVSHVGVILHTAIKTIRDELGADSARELRVAGDLP